MNNYLWAAVAEVCEAMDLPSALAADSNPIYTTPKPAAHMYANKTEYRPDQIEKT